MNRNLFFFLDETGVLNKPNDRFFGLGVLITGTPQTLYSKTQNLRDRSGFYDEVKWKTISSKKIPMIKEFINLFQKDLNSSFCCLFLDRAKLDYKKYFQNNYWKVYESFTVHLICASLPKGTRAVILADSYPAPEGVNFEENVIKRINLKLNREAILGICRINSKTSDLLQLNDLLLGAVSYEYKMSNNLIVEPGKIKVGVLEFLKESLNTKDLLNKSRGKKFRVLEFKK